MTFYNVHGVLPNGAISSPFCKCDMDRKTAGEYAKSYAARYVGKPYPNGTGYYPWTAVITLPVEDAADITVE